MKQVYLRLYEELNDYVSEEKKKRSFACRYEGALTVAELLRCVGVPVSRIDLLLVNDESVTGDYRICDGDRIAAYPVLESFDIKGTTRIREEPLRQPAFIAGAGLEALAGYLRLLGFDVLAGREGSAGELACMAEGEGRILLTHETPAAACVSRACTVRSAKPRAQAAEVLERLDLYRLARPFSRCLRCNAKLAPDRLSDQCTCCGQITPKGDRRRRMRLLASRLLRKQSPE